MMRVALLILFIFAVAANAQTLARNLEDSRAAIKAQKWKDAEITARAALKMEAGNQEAFWLLHQSLSGQGKKADALAAALDAYDAPKRGDSGAAKRTKAARDVLKAASPQLDSFLSLRASAAADVVKLRRGAERARRKADVEWIDDVLIRLAPTEEIVARETKGRSEQYWRQRGELGAPVLESGFKSLLAKPGMWAFALGAASSADENGIKLVPDPGRTTATVILKDDGQVTTDSFTLRARIKWQRVRADSPAGLELLLIHFRIGPDHEPGDVAIFIRVTQDLNAIDYCVRNADELKFRSASFGKLKDNQLPPDEWFDIEVSWGKKSDAMKVRVGKDEVMSAPTHGRSLAKRHVGFGMQCCESFEVSNVRIKNE
jgi:hypothetical protein